MNFQAIQQIISQIATIIMIKYQNLIIKYIIFIIIMIIISLHNKVKSAIIA